MKRAFVVAVLGVAFWATCAAAAPVTKQNGRTPVFSRFTPICSMPAFINYGYCGGNAHMFSNVGGRINAVQAKAGRWNLELTFTHLTPGVAYTLWGNRTGATPVPGVVNGWFAIGTTLADGSGSADFDYQTTSPTNLGFDLNTRDPNITLVTSWWSSQWLQILNASGALFVP